MICLSWKLGMRRKYLLSSYKDILVNMLKAEKLWDGRINGCKCILKSRFVIYKEDFNMSITHDKLSKCPASNKVWRLFFIRNEGKGNTYSLPNWRDSLEVNGRKVKLIYVIGGVNNNNWRAGLRDIDHLISSKEEEVNYTILCCIVLKRPVFILFKLFYQHFNPGLPIKPLLSHLKLMVVNLLYCDERIWVHFKELIQNESWCNTWL